MKKLQELLMKSPSYTKWGNKRIADLVGLKEPTIKRFKNTEEFKTIKANYLKSK